MARSIMMCSAVLALAAFGRVGAAPPEAKSDPRVPITALERLAPDKRSERQHVLLADHYHRAGRLDEALQAAEQALQRNADNADAWVIKGDVWRERARWEHALGAYNRAARSRPNTAEIELRRGQVLMALGRTREADAAFERYRALVPAGALK